MPERVTKLHALLDELEKELHSVESLDDQSRELLKEAVGEIQSALQEDDTEKLQHQSLADKLGESVVEFETSHPTLHGVVNRIIYMLGQMGI